MSFGQNPNYYGAPPGPPPQQGYGQGPPQQYGTPQGPVSGFPPPPAGYHQQPAGWHHQGPPPPGQFPPQGPPQNFGGPPGQYPPQQGFGVPPPDQHPPQQPFGAPPLSQYPPQQSYGGPPSFPSPGYDPRAVAPGDATREAEALRSAMKGFGTDEKALIQVLSKPDALHIALIRNTFNQRFNRSLEKDIEKETSSWFREGLLAIVRGPLMQDVHNVQKAIHGFGTKESFLNDVLLGRSNADMRAIKQAYQQAYHHTLEADVKGDLSMKTERLFGMAIAANRAEESAPIIPQEIDRDVTELHRATDGQIGTDQVTVCSILVQRSDGQLRMIAHQFEQKYHITLQKIIEKEFSGHMEDALLLIINRATDRTMTDAVQLEDAMKGAGTKDDLLMNRVARIHWDRAHMDQVRRAYQFRYKKDLIARIKGETRGDQENLLVAMLQ